VTTDLDTTRIVRSWLREDDHASADRILDDALARLHATPQLQPIGHGRGLAGIKAEVRFAAAMAAVVAVAVIGFNLLPHSSVPGVVPSPTTTTTPTPTTRPSLLPTPSPAVTPDAYGDIWRTGFYGSGSQSAKLGGVPFTFTIPGGGWSSYRWKAMIEKGSFPTASYAWIGFQWGADRVSDIDPCTAKSSGQNGPGIDDIAEAYTKIPGTDAVGPTDITIDHRPGTMVVLTIHDDIPCASSEFVLDGASTSPNALTSEIRLWFVDVDGIRFSIHSDRAAPNPELEQEIHDIIESIRFD